MKTFTREQVIQLAVQDFNKYREGFLASGRQASIDGINSLYEDTGNAPSTEYVDHIMHLVVELFDNKEVVG